MRSLWNMAADSGMMFCALGEENGSGFTVLPALHGHPLDTLLPSVSPCLLLPQLKLDHVLVGGQDKDGRKQLCVGFHLARGKRSRRKRRWAGGIVDSAWAQFCRTTLGHWRWTRAVGDLGLGHPDAARPRVSSSFRATCQLHLCVHRGPSRSAFSTHSAEAKASPDCLTLHSPPVCPNNADEGGALPAPNCTCRPNPQFTGDTRDKKRVRVTSQRL